MPAVSVCVCSCTRELRGARTFRATREVQSRLEKSHAVSQSLSIFRICALKAEIGKPVSQKNPGPRRGRCHETLDEDRSTRFDRPGRVQHRCLGAGPPRRRATTFHDAARGARSHGHAYHGGSRVGRNSGWPATRGGGRLVADARRGLLDKTRHRASQPDLLSSRLSLLLLHSSPSAWGFAASTARCLEV